MDYSVDSFSWWFASCCKSCLVYYMFCSYRINFKGNKELYASGFCMDDECWRLYEEKIHAILAKGLNDRAKFIRVIWRNAQCQWSVNDVWFQAWIFSISFEICFMFFLIPFCLWLNLQLQGLSILDKEPLFIGISVSDLEKAFRMVDIGPNAESKEQVHSFVHVHSVSPFVFKFLLLWMYHCPYSLFQAGSWISEVLGRKIRA